MDVIQVETSAVCPVKDEEIATLPHHLPFWFLQNILFAMLKGLYILSCWQSDVMVSVACMLYQQHCLLQHLPPRVQVFYPSPRCQYLSHSASPSLELMILLPQLLEFWNYSLCHYAQLLIHFLKAQVSLKIVILFLCCDYPRASSSVMIYLLFVKVCCFYTGRHCQTNLHIFCCSFLFNTR